MKTANLKAPYGIIPMPNLRNRTLNTTQKLIFAILAAKQGGSNYAKVSNQMLADALRTTTRTVSSALTELKNHNLINEVSRGKIHVDIQGIQFGLVELSFLVASNLSTKAKYLYLIYCVAGNDHDANYWGRDSVCETFQMSNSTYQEAHKELVDKEILKVVMQASAPNVQTANINIISRANKCNLTIPSSWAPQEAFDLDEWCELNFDENGELKCEVSVIETGRMGTSKQEESVQRIVTTNSNLNISPSTKLTTNEDLHPTISLKVSEVTPPVTQPDNEEDSFDYDEGDFNRLLQTRLLTKKKALKVLNDINTKIGLSENMMKYIDDETMLEKVFFAHDTLREILEINDIDTSKYALNFGDLEKFTEFVARISHLPSEKKIKYHVERVVQLGIEKENNPYVSMSYVFSQEADLKEEIKSQKALSKGLQGTSAQVSDNFMYKGIS